MKGHWNFYSEEELAWIKDRKEQPRRELYEAFIAHFDRREITLGAFKGLCKRKGWMTGRTGCYEKGRTSENKGKKLPYNANSAKTQFKKGTRNGRAEERYKPIGTERSHRDGYLERKIHDDMPLQSRWRRVHLINWEAENGPLPEGYCLKCLDGNKANTDPSNWEAIPRAMLPRLAGSHTLGYDDAPDELKPVIMATAKLEHAAREKQRGGNQ